MTATFLAETTKEQGAVIATFGGAALIKNSSGGYALAGGSSADRVEAREWISLFMHEVVVREK